MVLEDYLVKTLIGRVLCFGPRLIKPRRGLDIDNLNNKHIVCN